ncbi:MAG: hypothetical protein JWM57_2985 [Phycisphaerales bacterium]|nr:hypothetical protein [Phycisphaerales bacterium]
MYAQQYKGYLVPNITGAAQGNVDFSQSGARMFGPATLAYERFLRGTVTYSPDDTERSYATYSKIWDALWAGKPVPSDAAWASAPNNFPLVIPVTFVLREPPTLDGLPYNTTTTGPQPYKANQARWGSELTNPPTYQFRPPKLGKRMSIVADRFVSSYMYSFHDGKQFLAGNAAGKATRNGFGWHVGFSDGSVVLFPTDPTVYVVGNTVGAATDFNDRWKNWVYWDNMQNP